MPLLYQYQVASTGPHVYLSAQANTLDAGPSDLVVILNVIADFLHKPYNSVEDPLDLWFHSLQANSVVPAFGIGYSVGMAKSMAALAILFAVQALEKSGQLSVQEFTTIAPEVTALLSMRAMTDPGSSIEEQVSKSISKKFRVTDRPRPHVIQLHTAFSKVVQHMRAAGDTKPESQLLALAIKTFNSKQTAKNRVQTDEREAILNLHNQTDTFRKTLAEHWQTYPVPYSAVPVSLLAKAWHSDSYDPPVKKSIAPRTYEALLGNSEKREMWLKRVIGKYLKNLKDAKSSGKAVNIRSMGPVLRKEVDEEFVRHMACIFTAWLPQFRSSVSPKALDELLDRFYRGALDRELAEKVKSADESLALADWRFVSCLAEFTGQLSGDGSHEDAAATKQAADLNYDLMLLRKEQKIWGTYMTALRLFRADTHNAKVEEQELVAEQWSMAAKTHIDIRFPVVGLKSQMDAPSAITTMVENFAEHLATPKHELYKVYVANLTFVGSSYEKRIAELVAIVKDKLLNDQERSCVLIVAPNTGSYKQTYDEKAAEMARRDVLDMLRDDAHEFSVAEVTVFIDPASMWSKSRRTKHEIYMVISDRRNEKGEHKSHFSTSQMFIRQSLSKWVTCHPRHEHVDPTQRISTERGNLSQMRERMQWITGESLYAVLCSDLWLGMGLSCEAGACWIDLIGYDHCLSLAIMNRAGSPDSSSPVEMVGTTVTGFGPAGKQVEEFIESRIYNKLRSKCEEKSYVLPGAPDLAATTNSSKIFVKPTYNESDFAVTKPLADETLPVRSCIVDKWGVSSGVPASLADTFQAELIKHNATHNKSGRPYCPESGKRPAPEPAVGQDAVVLPLPEGGPTSVDDLVKIHPQMCEKTVKDVKFMSSIDGDVYAIVNEDVVFSKNTPVALMAGEYLVGTKYDTAKKDGMDLFTWQMDSDGYMATFFSEPDLGFTSDISALSSFLFFLESKAKVGTKIECHTHKRGTATGSYTVSPSERCGFRTKGRGLVNGKVPFCSGVSASVVEESQHMHMVMRLKYVDEQKTIQPARPGLYFKKDVRMHPGIYKLL